MMAKVSGVCVWLCARGRGTDILGAVKSGVTIALALGALMACRGRGELHVNGRVEAYLSDVGPRTSGRIVALAVREGQRVKQGDLLVRLAAEELDAALARDKAAAASAQAKALELNRGTRLEQIAQGEARLQDAEAAVALAERHFARVEPLVKEGALSHAELDRARAERDRAHAARILQQKLLAELRAGARVEQRQAAAAESQKAKAVMTGSLVQAGFTEIRAPFDGVVIHRLREVGTVVSPGQAIVTLARQDALWVRIYIPQPMQSRLSLGMPLRVQTLDNRSFQATLDEVASDPEYTPKMVETVEERVNLVFPAMVHIPDGWGKGLLPGTAVDVYLKPTNGK